MKLNQKGMSNLTAASKKMPVATFRHTEKSKYALDSLVKYFDSLNTLSDMGAKISDSDIIRRAIQEMYFNYIVEPERDRKRFE